MVVGARANKSERAWKRAANHHAPLDNVGLGLVGEEKADIAVDAVGQLAEPWGVLLLRGPPQRKSHDLVLGHEEPAVLPVRAHFLWTKNTGTRRIRIEIGVHRDCQAPMASGSVLEIAASGATGGRDEGWRAVHADRGRRGSGRGGDLEVRIPHVLH